MAAPETEARVAVRVAPLALDAATAFGWAVAFGICTVSYYILRGLFNFAEDFTHAVFGWIPGVGKWVESKLETAEHKLTHWVGQAAAGSERRMAAAFHASADLVGSIGHEIEGLAIAYWQGVRWIAHVSWVGLQATQKATHNAGLWLATKAHLAQQDRRINAQAQAIRHADRSPIAAGIKTATKPIAARTTWIDAHELPGIRARQRAGDIAIPRDYPSTREKARTAERSAGALWDRLRDISWRTAGLGAVALVTVALGRLGLGWLRCSNVTRVGKRLCRMNPSTLEDLLLGTLAIAGTLSIVELAKELQAEVGPAAQGIHTLIRR